jgi:hypothetical protein
MMADAVFRPRDDRYWVRTWSTVLFAGDLFAAIPFGEQPFEAVVDVAGHGKHFVGPVAYGYGLLISPTCDMVDQKTFEVAHPYRVLVPVLPLSMVARGSPATAHNAGLIRGRDQVIPYMYLPPLASVLSEESVACLYRPTTVSDEFLRDPPRRVAQLHPEARRQLKIKLARYWARVSPNRDDIALLEMDEAAVTAHGASRSPYDIDHIFPDEAPGWPGAT